jgi:apolipoprotein D and lipocalin family protein
LSAKGVFHISEKVFITERNKIITSRPELVLGIYFIYDLCMKIDKHMFILLTFSISLLACASGMKKGLPPLKVVTFVDLNRYAGTWYEISRFPNRFQKGCVGTTATYTIRKDGKIGVVNQCRKGTLDGEISSVKGTAWIVDKKTNAKLKVSFFWPFSGHYWIIDLGENYDYAVVGQPDRKYLWILSRLPKMDEKIYNLILEKLKLQFYDTSKLIKTLQFE